MSLYKINSGIDTSFSTKLNSNIATALRESGRLTIRQLQDRSIDFSADGGEWAEAYIDSNGRENSVDTGETTAVFDTDKYKSADYNDMSYYIIISATSLNESSFYINDCRLAKHKTENKWLLYATSGTTEERKAKVIKTLFYGTDGTDYRIDNTYITGLTNLYTSDSDDVGKRGHYINITGSNNDDSTTRDLKLECTFANTVDNTDVNIWWSMVVSGNASVSYTRLYIPSSTERVYFEDADSNSTFESDTTAYDTSNPDKLILESTVTRPVSGYTISFNHKAILLSNSTISSVDSSNVPVHSYTIIDFYTDKSVPLLSDGTSYNIYDFIVEVHHNIPSGTLSSTISSSFGTFLAEDWEEGADIQYKLTNASEDTGWLNTNEVSTFTAFISEPTKCIVKLIPKSSSPTTGYPSIKGFYVVE